GGPRAWSSRRPSPRSRRRRRVPSTSSLTEHGGVHPAVARPALLGVLLTQRQLLPVTDRLQTLGGNALPHQVVLDGLCALRAQRQIVLDGPAVVAMPLELDGGLGVVAQPGDVVVELGTRRLVDVVAVVVEVDVLQRAALGGTEALPRPLDTAPDAHPGPAPPPPHPLP